MREIRGTKSIRNRWSLLLSLVQLSLILLATPAASFAATSYLDPLNSYFFAATSYNSTGLESVYFNVVGNADAAPATLTIATPPDGTLFNDVVAINVATPQDVAISKVQFFVNNVQVAETATAPYAFSWNTAPLARGDYTISVKAFDAAGNQEVSDSLPVTVAGDTISPTVSLSAPADNATVSGIVVASAGASDNVGVAKVEMYLDGILVSSSTQSSASYTWNTSAASNGSHVLTAIATDAAGNSGQSSPVTVTVFNDTTAPVVSIGAPASSSTVGGTVAVTANASDNVAVSKVEFYLNGSLQSTSNGSPYGFNWNTSALANGSYTLIAKAYDAAGNIGTSAGVAVTVFNDTSAPAVSIASPTNNSTAGGSVVVSANASDNVAVTKVEFYLNGVLKATTSSAPYNYTWNTAAIANGSYTLSAKAYDAAGNVGTSTNVAVNVFNDTTAPAVNAFTLPATTNSTTVAVSSLSATDNVGVTGYLISESATAPAASDPGWTSIAPTSFTFAGTGARTAYAWAKDAAGNVSASKAGSVLIDTTLPSIKNISLNRGGSSVTVKASATDNVGIAKLQLYVDNTLALESPNGSLLYTWAVTFKGIHTFTVKAFDAAGNVRSQSLTMNK